MQIKVAARSSRLSKVQVQEVLHLLQRFEKSTLFKAKFIQTKGDKDLKTSLLTQDKTDFFTKEVDELVLQKVVDVGIHSAKDLPDPLHPDLKIFAITKGVCSKDCLVMRDEMTFSTLPIGAKIGTSSKQRRDNINLLRQDFQVVDIRGDIFQRLSLLDEGKVDGVIMARAAIIRLKLDVNTKVLDFPTAKGQGQLAVIGRKNNHGLQEFFKKIDSRVGNLVLS